MEKELPLWHRLYLDPVYTAVAREIGYHGCVYRDLRQKIELLSKQFEKVKVESALHNLVTYEGQMTVNPKPLAEVRFRDDARKACWQLLGPPPEKMKAFNTNPDGSPRQGTKATSATSAPEPKEKPKPVRNEPPTKKTRKKKVEPEKTAATNRSGADASSIVAQYRAAKEKHPDMMLLFRNVAQ